jgi:hypothetical protein
MLPSDFYLVARHEARFHVQVRLDHVADVARTPCFAAVDTTVVRVFRDGDTLKPGDEITFGIAVTRPGDEIPASGIVWKAHSTLVEARYAEVFLNGTPPDYEIALSNCTLIEEPTDKAQMRGSYHILARRHRKMREEANKNP